jgi:glycosyltransferase involved in cell wall biosynthesis
VTDVGDLRDLIVDTRNGYVCPVGDIEGLAAATERLLESDAGYNRASSAAREAALERSIPRLTALYREILLQR